MCRGEGSTIDDTIKIYVREAIYVRGHALLQSGGKGERVKFRYSEKVTQFEKKISHHI